MDWYKNMAVSHRKQLENDTRVLFSHVSFQNVLELKWVLIKVKRLEQIYDGVALGCTVDPKWVNFESELQKYYGPMDTESLHFKKLLVAFQMQRWEVIIKMFEDESGIMERMLKENKVPSDFPQQLAALKERRSRLETWITVLSKLQCDQNPYTNPDNMDFWVMPRPQRAIEDYGLQYVGTGSFLKYVVLPDGTGVWRQVEIKDEKDLFVRKGYNAAVFDVGWHFPMKAFCDLPWNYYLDRYSGRRSTNFDEEKRTIRFIDMRGDLMKFNPFGVEATGFSKLVRNKYQIQENESIFGSVVDQNCVSELVFPQILRNSSGGANKIILFDNHFEGVIVTPVEMLIRIWNRIRFLIDERPNQLLPLDSLEKIYESCFRQKFYPLQWGFKDVEDFVQNVRDYLPKEITEDVTIVTKDEVELGKIDSDAGAKAKTVADAKVKEKIHPKLAKILENDDDDEEYEFDYADLFEPLVHKGPWVAEGEVYRVLD